MLKAHRTGKAAIKATRPHLPVGATLAVSDERAVGDRSLRDQMRAVFYRDWIDNVRGDDFVGVQNYLANIWGDKGVLPPPSEAVRDAEGRAITPSSLGGAVRYVHEATGCPVLVTEHGYDVGDDAIRAKQRPLALAELKRTIEDDVAVLGYVHWSLLDNFEWMSGYVPTYGLASVDRLTFARKLKPSAAVYGRIARQNAL